jgi:KDEL-tailed cysteine endopeptidase
MAKMAASGFTLGVVLAIYCLAASTLALRTEVEMSNVFEDWLESNPRPYSNDANEKMARYEIFKSNLQFIDEKNAEQTSYTLALNQFSDLTNEEFKSKHLGFRPSETAQESTPFRYANAVAPAAIDWRTKGAVTPIKDQGGCGTIAHTLEFYNMAYYPSFPALHMSYHSFKFNSLVISIHLHSKDY